MKMRIPAAYVRSGEVLFAVLGSDNADLPAVKQAAAEALKVPEEEVLAALPADGFTVMKVVDLSDLGAEAAPRPAPAPQPDDSTAVEKAQAGMSSFYATLGRSTPPAPKGAAPGIPSAFDYGKIIRGKGRKQ